MSNFKGWTSEAIEAREQRQLAKRLDAMTLKNPNGLKAYTRKETPSGTEIKIIKPRKATKAQPEYKLQAAYVKWVNATYPRVLVFSDTAAHISKTMIQQSRANALQTPGQKWPDVFLAQPSGDFAGLFIEFKAQSPFKKDGVTLLKNEHIEAQAATMERLAVAGYDCYFAWQLDQAKEITNNYLGK